MPPASGETEGPKMERLSVERLSMKRQAKVDLAEPSGVATTMSPRA
jgi:hypothetical protein